MTKFNISLTDARRITKADGVSDLNIEQVQDVVTCWAGIMSTHGVYYVTLTAFKRSLAQRGLVRVMATCDDYREFILQVLEGAGWDNPVTVKSLISQIKRRFNPTDIISLIIDEIAAKVLNTVGVDSDANHEGYLVLFLADVFQVLCFPKRFTYIANEATMKASLDSFFEANRTCRRYAYEWDIWPGPTIIGMAREVFREIYPTKRLKPLRGGFSDGSCVDARGRNNTLVSKLRVLANTRPCFEGDLRYPFPGGDTQDEIDNVPHLLCVPKSFDVFRVIAPEYVHMVYDAHGMLEALRRATAKGAGRYIHEHEAVFNRLVAASSSAGGDLDPLRAGIEASEVEDYLIPREDMATIDLHGASDSIAKSLFAAVVPPAYWASIYPYLSWSVTSTDFGTRRTAYLWTLLTSGNPLTWYNEGCWFLGLGRLGCRLAGIKNYKRAVFSHGDDLEVPADAYETVCDVLRLFGHRVNDSKSYAHGKFRESCGGWYYAGWNITPFWWPRHAFDPRDKVTYLLGLIQLQHLLYGFGPCREYLTAKVRRLFPKMTSSPVYTDCADLWDGAIDAAEAEAYGHYAPCTVYDKIDLIKADTCLYEHWLYYNFLAKGPRYDSELDRLLGVSSPIRSDGDLAQGKLTLKKTPALLGRYGKTW